MILKVLLNPTNSLKFHFSKLLELARKQSSTANNNNNFDFNDINEQDKNDTSLISSLPDVEEALEKKEKYSKFIEHCRDVNRFSKFQAYKKYHELLPIKFSIKNEDSLSKLNFFRRKFMKFGEKSGIDKEILWPGKNELRTIINERNEFELPLNKKIQLLIERKRNQIDTIKKTQNETDEALKKMPKQIENFYQRLVKKEKSEEEREAKKREILDQAREYYGYDVNQKDPRIKEMLDKLQQQKKSEEKRMKKEKQKEHQSKSKL